MDIINFLNKSSLYNVLSAESLMSEDFRKGLSKVSKVMIFTLIFVLLFFYFTKSSDRFGNFKDFVEQYSLTQRTLGLILINIGVFIYSQLAEFYLSSTYYFEKIVKNVYTKEELYTFSAGRILYAGRKTDILHGFFDSKIGKLTFEKLGIDKKETKFFYNSQKITPKEEAPLKSGEILRVKDLAMYVYFKKPEFVEFLSHRGITDKKFFEVIERVISDIETKEYKKQWWRPEVLTEIKPLIK